ncbi:hypothetical protein ABMA27_001109 [Loxostege sticticalis]|uniref:DUF7869 domain-containing protein n=1 Tax=Loxostege sticticalis TaxID=481309 RepID=A0ABR3I1K1_LOXSC
MLLDYKGHAQELLNTSIQEKNKTQEYEDHGTLLDSIDRQQKASSTSKNQHLETELQKDQNVSFDNDAIPSTSMDQNSIENPAILQQDFLDNCSDDSVKDPDYTTPKKTKRSLSSSSSTSSSSTSSSSSSSSSSSCSFSSRQKSSKAKTNLKVSESQGDAQCTAAANTIPGIELNQTENFDHSSEKKRGRKRKAEPSKWQREKAKTLRNLGKSYAPNSKKKHVVPERSLKPSCSNTCKFKCTELISHKKRQIIFDSFWAMGDLQLQREFIARHLTMIKPRYAYKVHNSKRGNNFAFYLTVDDQKIRVCKRFFRATLDISDRPIKTVIEKMTESGTGILAPDNRGKHGKHKSVDVTIKNAIRQHIQSIPKVESHYCRASTSREYIDGSKNMTDLHTDYVNECKAKGTPYGNYVMYNRIFNSEFNLSFHNPKKDQCEDCAAFHNAIGEEKERLRESYELHLKEKELTRKEKETDKKDTLENVIVAVYDLEATLSCPRGDVSNFNYVSKINVYNFTIRDLKSGAVDCYVWHEVESKRGAIEIGSCVLKYIENLKQKADEIGQKLDIIFYSDNCCGQNKNHYIIGLYMYIVQNFEYVNSITHKFLIKGHTQNEGDNVHSVIESQIKKILKGGPIYTPDQYVSIIRNAKKRGDPYKVHELTHDDFYDIKALADSVGNNYSKNTENETVKITRIKILKFEASNESFKYCVSYETQDFKEVKLNINKRKRQNRNVAIEIQKAYKQKFSVADKKKKGLLELVSKNIIPRFYSSFYTNL